MTILLVRHAETEANINEQLYRTVADASVALTDRGRAQAAKVGEFIQNYFDIAPPLSRPRLWISTYKRTEQTGALLQQNAPKVNWDVSRATGQPFFFDDRLREREFGLFDGNTDDENAAKYPDAWQHYKKNLDHNTYYAKPLNGESPANVADRVRSFKETMWRDIQNGKKAHVIVTHGLTLRCFVNAFLNKHPEAFMFDKNPGNTAVRLLEKDELKGRYTDRGYIYDGAKALIPV